MEQKKTRTEIYKNENPGEALRKVMEYYGDDIPTSKTKNVSCPFHNDKNPSFNVMWDKGYFQCFSDCGAKGDAFEYIKLKENCNFQEALTKAGEIFGTKEEKQGLSKIERLEKFVRDNFTEFSGDKEYKYEDHYISKAEGGEAVFIKIKFRHPETKDKSFLMANIIDEGSKYRLDFKSDKLNVFYNAHLIKKAIEDNEKIYIVEGEKDADTLTKLGFVAISCRNTKSLTKDMINSLSGANIVVVPDMDSVGGEHEKFLTDSLSNGAFSFRVLKLYELKKIGGKDITDYVEYLKKRDYGSEEIKNRIVELTQGALNTKAKYELQQDKRGIKKFQPQTNKETGDVTYVPIYITNFRITEARICVNPDEDKEYIELVTERYKYLSSEKPVTKIIRGNVKDILTDTRSFVEELGFGLSFYGTGKDLTALKEWIDRYFLVDEKQEYLKVGIRDDIYIDGKKQKCLMTQSGALMLDGTLNTSVKAVSEFALIDLEGRKMLTKDDANELLKYMFKYTNARNAYNTWGSLVAGMLNPYYGKSSLNTHVLHIWGASGKGKSYALENVIIPVLNTDAPLSFESTTPHALLRAFNESTMITLMDEVKPSKSLTNRRINNLSNVIRELTGTSRTLKGNKGQGANVYGYNSTLIMVGEEEIEETAVKNRSNQVVYTDTTTTEEHIKHGLVLMTEEYRTRLNDLGYTLYLEILQNWNSKRIDETKLEILDKYPLKNKINVREQGTYVGTVMGLMILEEVLERITGKKLKLVEKAVKHIEDNIFEHILDNGEASKQNYEQWLELFEEMVSTSDYKHLLEVDIHFRKVVEDNEECLAIAFSDAYDKTYEKAIKVGQKLENNRTIKKLLGNSKYAHKIKTKKYKFSTTEFGTKKTKDALVLKMSELENLNMTNTLEIARNNYDK